MPPIALIYTDGGGDHCCNQLSVQLALIGLFFESDLDELVAVILDIAGRIQLKV